MQSPKVFKKSLGSFFLAILNTIQITNARHFAQLHTIAKHTQNTCLLLYFSEMML